MYVYQLASGPGVIRLPDRRYIPNDPANTDWQEYEAWCAAGNAPQAASTSASAPIVVTAAQLRRALAERGILQAVVSAVAAADLLTQQLWQAAHTISSDDPTVTAIAAAIGKSQSDLVSVF